MSFNNRRWCIIQSNEIDTLSVDFSKVITTSRNTARNSVNGDYILLKYTGNQPSFLSNKTEYTHSQIRTILNGNDWKFPDME